MDDEMIRTDPHAGCKRLVDDSFVLSLRARTGNLPYRTEATGLPCPVPFPALPDQCREGRKEGRDRALLS